ncbi:L-cystine transport system substrate-binding protein [Eubacterium uniforme]|uniref:L-cystine transport system substrate-binding protein n=1 Tax=Eubacterium uniforme TaxID=39495 RepID=A0A1T4VV78_9FIRM|nr:transporter substrate-binding domain-containing protein [Eubacterium uniforme]SKA68910.1 L-cystine transport system substrate-binding protein [Eubacterium uniforme]
MKKIIKKLVSVTLAATLIASSLAGCGNTSEAKGKGKDSSGKKVIKVGTGAVWNPYLFLDEDDNLVGFDIDVAKAVGDKLGYEVEFGIEDFENLLTSVGSGKYDLVTFELGYNDERAEKYLFSSVPFNQIEVYLVVSADSDVKDISELQDVHLWSGDASSTYYAFLDNYVKEHPEQNITIDVRGGTEFDETCIEAVKNGTYAGLISNKVSINNVNKTYGDVYKPVGDPVIVQDTYHIFNKEKQELRDEWDKALKELIDDGTIAKLQKKWNV